MAKITVLASTKPVNIDTKTVWTTGVPTTFNGISLPRK